MLYARFCIQNKLKYYTMFNQISPEYKFGLSRSLNRGQGLILYIPKKKRKEKRFNSYTSNLLN